MDKLENLIKELKSLGFSELEAKIYLELQSEGKLSAYQLAKKIEIARPSIYNALEHMAEKGMVDLVPEKTPLYVAKDYKLLFEKINANMQESMAKANDLMKKFVSSRALEECLLINGYDSIILESKKILKNAKNDIYINADFDLEVFADEFEMLKKKKISIYVFSFMDIRTGCDWTQLFTHKRQKSQNDFAKRFMLAEHKNISITAGRNSEFDDWKGMVTNVPLNVEIVEEHIHNDIYLLKCRDQFGRGIYETGKLSSQFEKEREF